MVDPVPTIEEIHTFRTAHVRSLVREYNIPKRNNLNREQLIAALTTYLEKEIQDV